MRTLLGIRMKCGNLLLLSLSMAYCMHSCIADEAGLEEEPQEDYCVSESFQPRCMKHEVVFIKSAIYGRMRIGRCITAAEIETLRSHYLGCSTNVLPLLDRKCFGRTECEVRVAEISVENIRPCPPGLNVYLEVSYDCISIVNERQSCAVDASTNPVHIISSTTCGTSSQPWIVEAPVGQKLSISILEFPRGPTEAGQRGQSCHNRGLIVDKVGKRNATICVGETQRGKELFLSTGNSVHIFFNQTVSMERTGSDRQFILRIRGVGCSNIIPPVDGYSKRNGDSIMIGCYASRKTWHLNCESGKWIGVIGNCSQGVHAVEVVAESEPIATTLNNEHVLAFVAIGGFTVAICLAILCLGFVCMRRFRVKNKMKRDYKTLTLNCGFSSARNQGTDNRVRNVAQEFSEDNVRGLVPNELPTYSMFVGDGEFNDISNSIGVENNHR